MAQNETSNPGDDAADLLKKRARRRLVGSIALVLFAVITLPLVMEHEPRPAGPEIQVRIPSQESPANDPRANPKLDKADKTASAKLERAATAEDAPPVTRPEMAPAARGEAKSAPAVEANPASGPDKAAKAESAGETKKDVKVESKVASKAEAKADPKSESKSDADAVRAAAALSDAGGGEYVVQLGAYQEAGRVKLLLGKIKELGLPAYTEKVDTPQGPRTRVRAGPFPTREAANKAQERIKIIGVSGPVAPK